MEIKNQDIIHWSWKMTKRSKKDMMKYCHFYWKYGHNTKSYFSLKKEIEGFVQWGYLQIHVKQPKDVKTFGC